MSLPPPITEPRGNSQIIQHNDPNKNTRRSLILTALITSIAAMAFYGKNSSIPSLCHEIQLEANKDIGHILKQSHNVTGCFIRAIDSEPSGISFCSNRDLNLIPNTAYPLLALSNVATSLIAATTNNRKHRSYLAVGGTLTSLFNSVSYGTAYLGSEYMSSDRMMDNMPRYVKMKFLESERICNTKGSEALQKKSIIRASKNSEILKLAKKISHISTATFEISLEVVASSIMSALLVFSSYLYKQTS